MRLNRIGVDRIINLGDTESIGPHPEECVQMIGNYPIDSVRGNHEEYILKGLDSENLPGDMEAGEYYHHVWTEGCLSLGSIELMESWPLILDGDADYPQLTFFHSPPSAMKAALLDSPIPAFPIKTILRLIFLLSGGMLFVSVIHISPLTFITLVLQKGDIRVREHRVPYERDRVLKDMVKLDVPDHQFILKIFFGVT